MPFFSKPFFLNCFRRHNNSFEFMIFNGGNLVWKYLKSWGEMSRQALCGFLLSRKLDCSDQKQEQQKKLHEAAGKKVVVQFSSWLPDNLHLRNRRTQTIFTLYSCLLLWFSGGSFGQYWVYYCSDQISNPQLCKLSLDFLCTYVPFTNIQLRISIS